MLTHSSNAAEKIHSNGIPDGLYEEEAKIEVGLSKNGAFLTCHTDKGNKPIFFRNLMSEINESPLRDLGLRPFLRLTYNNAEIVGIDADIYIPDPKKVVDCKGLDFCVDVNRHRKFNRIVAIDFLEKEISSRSQERGREGFSLVWPYQTMFRVQMF